LSVDIDDYDKVVGLININVCEALRPMISDFLTASTCRHLALLAADQILVVILINRIPNYNVSPSNITATLLLLNFLLCTVVTLHRTNDGTRDAQTKR
jgi:hypothetical protein